MARLINKTQEIKPEDISTTINNYYKDNTEKLRLDKILKQYSSRIKSYFESNNLSTLTTDIVTATISESSSLSYDEDLLMNAVKQLPQEYQSRLIDTVEVVNMEALERLMVSGDLNPDLFKAAQVEKITKKLLVKRNKD